MSVSEAVAAPARGRLDRRVVALALVSLGTYLLVRAVLDPSMIDFEVYRLEGVALRSGHDLYGDLGAPQGLRATYPPFAAMLFVPFTVLSPFAGQVVANIANVALVAVVSWQSCRLAGVPRPQQVNTTLVVAAAALWAEPVFTSLGNGQINLALLALVLSDFMPHTSERRRGVGVGIAAGLKVTPLVFVGYLILTRRYRAAGVATATFALTLAGSGLAAPRDTRNFWTRYLFDSNRVGRLVNSTNQSLPGLIARLARVAEPTTFLSVTGAVVTLVGLGVAARAYRRLDDAWGLPVCAVAGLLGAPIAWTHHWVWCIPIGVVLYRWRPRSLPLVVVFWTFVPFLFAHAPVDVLRYPLWKLLLTGSYVLFGAVFMLTAARRSVADPGRDVPILTTESA